MVLVYRIKIKKSIFGLFRNVNKYVQMKIITLSTHSNFIVEITVRKIDFLISDIFICFVDLHSLLLGKKMLEILLFKIFN